MKWKNLRPVESPHQPRWLDPMHHRRVRRLAEKVRHRTGADAWVDTARAELCFGYNAGDGDVKLPLSVKMFRDLYRTVPVRFEGAHDVWTEDDIVYCLQLARLSPEVKAKWQQYHEASRKHDADEEVERRLEQSFKTALARTERDYERYSMGRHYKGRAQVNGLKGAA